jgi:hypothetical protein
MPDSPGRSRTRTRTRRLLLVQGLRCFEWTATGPRPAAVRRSRVVAPAGRARRRRAGCQWSRLQTAVPVGARTFVPDATCRACQCKQLGLEAAAGGSGIQRLCASAGVPSPRLRVEPEGLGQASEATGLQLTPGRARTCCGPLVTRAHWHGTGPGLAPSREYPLARRSAGGAWGGPLPVALEARGPGALHYY